MKNKEIRYCNFCNEPLECGKRIDSKFCDDICKNNYHNKDKRENSTHNKYKIYSENGTSYNLDVVKSKPVPYDDKSQNGRKVVKIKTSLNAKQENQEIKNSNSIYIGGVAVFFGIFSLLLFRR